MNIFTINNVLTQDQKLVQLCFCCKNGYDPTLIQNIVNYVGTQMNQQNAITQKSAFYSQQNFADGQGRTRTFEIGFLLTYNNDFSSVLSADLVSCYEK